MTEGTSTETTAVEGTDTENVAVESTVIETATAGSTNTETATPQNFNLQVLNTGYGANTDLETMSASADQVFADFVGDYTPEQQKVIFDEISKHLYATQGNCTIRWHGVGEDKKDYIRTTYSDGQLVEFEMRNRDVSDEQSQDSRIIFRTDNSEAYLKYKEKVKNATGKSKKAAQIEIDSEGLSLKGRQTVSTVSVGLDSEYRRESNSQTLINNGEGTRVTRANNDFYAHTGISGSSIGISREASGEYYDKDGNLIRTKEGNLSFTLGADGINAGASATNTQYNQDGSSKTNGYHINLAMSGGLVINGGVLYRSNDVYGNVLSETVVDAGAAVGINRLATNLNAQTTRTDADGNLISKELTLNAHAGTGNIGAGCDTQTIITYADGSKFSASNGFGANVGTLGTNLHRYNSTYNIAQNGTVSDGRDYNFAVGCTFLNNGVAMQYARAERTYIDGQITENSRSYLVDVGKDHLNFTQTENDIIKKQLSLDAGNMILATLGIPTNTNPTNTLKEENIGTLRNALSSNSQSAVGIINNLTSADKPENTLAENTTSNEVTPTSAIPIKRGNGYGSY